MFLLRETKMLQFKSLHNKEIIPIELGTKKFAKILPWVFINIFEIFREQLEN